MPEREFDCKDCGTHVVHFSSVVIANDNPEPDADYCFHCGWLRDHPDAPPEIVAHFKHAARS